MNSEQDTHSAPVSIPQVLLSLPGDIGEMARYIYSFARYPEADIALAGAISIYSGIVGKAFNEPDGAGLNTYTLYLAPTGAGKNIVKEARGRLFLELSKTVPAIEDFKGPGDLGSAAGGTRWLEKRPCCLSIFGEFGPVLKKITSPKANANDEAICRFVLDAYSNSGEGSSIDPIAYSDAAKNTATLYGTSYSIFAESVPERIFNSFSEDLIASGLLPRFDVWESNQPRPYINQNRITKPSPALVEKLANLAGYCLTQSNQGRVNVPKFGPGAKARLLEFEAFATDQINASSEVPRQLWNRAYLKVAKLASLRAIGINHIAPVITLDDVDWAGNIVATQTRNLITRFTNGDVGEVEGNEAKQISEVIRVIRDYTHTANDFDKVAAKYGGHFDMHKHGVIPEAYIQRRLMTLKAFKPYPTRSIKQAIKSLLEADDLREMAPTQMLEKYGVKPRAFVVANPARFK